MVRVREEWLITYSVYKSPHKDRHLRECVCVCVCVNKMRRLEQETKLMIKAQASPVLLLAHPTLTHNKESFVFL